MSKTLSKNRDKRPRTTSNENNTSFVKNVTSKVSGLLPATITKWFSSPSSSNANGSAPTADASDSSTEDEGLESPVVTQPPAKRMRFNTSNKFNHFGPPDMNCPPSSIEITEIPASHFPGTQFTASRNNMSQTSMRSTNETFKSESIKDKSERDASRYKSLQHTVASIGHSVAAKRKSIFEKTKNDTANQTDSKPSTSDIRRPYFKPALLGSPFYPGRTVYGGAASSYINQPNIQQQTVALVNESKSNENSTMSTSARRIMDLLESYSSPLMEARRIPHYTKPKAESFNISSSTNHSLPHENKSFSYKTQELHVPSIASILRLKQRSRLMDTTKAARQIIASHSSASSYPSPYPTINKPETTNIRHTSQELQPRPETETEQNKKMTTKVKTRIARTNRGNHDQVDIATPVKLPSATLQIDQDKLPKFSFDTPTVTKLPATSTPKLVQPVHKPIVTKKNIEVPTSKPEMFTSRSDFKFSNPVEVSCDTPESETTPPKFTFDSPERRIDEHFGSKSDVSSVVGKAKETENTIKAKDWACPDCWVNNKPEVSKCACCGYVKTKVDKCNICKLADSQAQKENCVNCEKMSIRKSTNSSQSSEWKCDDCWVMNKQSVEKCACCGARKPVVSGKPTEATHLKTADLKPNTGSSSLFSTTGSSFVNAKPLPSKSTNFFGSNDTADGTFVSIAKTQKSDKWECSSCLVRNESDKSTCVCCGAEKEPKSKIPATKFNFGVNTNTSFKFGIDPKEQEATLVKKPEVQITTGDKVKEQSETNNNVLAETPTFTFKLPTKKIEPNNEIVAVKPTEPAKFSFGIPKSVTVSTSNSETPKTIVEDKEKPQEVPQINFASPVDENKKIGGLFASPMIKDVDKDKPLLPVANMFALPTAETKKEVPKESAVLSTAVTSVEKSITQNSFSLASPSLKIASNLFSTPTCVVGSSNMFSSPTQGTPVTTSASTAPLVLPTAPLQKSDTANVLPAPTMPIFSFGINGVNNPSPLPSVTVATSVEKPKFQFTFGNSNPPKSDSIPSLLASSTNTSSLFKSTFASPTENTSKNTNTFGISPGNSLVPNNALSTNALGGTNGMPASNGLLGNSLPGNTLGGNTLSGNGLSGNLLANNTFRSSMANSTVANNTFGANTSNNTMANNTFGSNTANNSMTNNTFGANAVNNTMANNTFGSNTANNSLATNTFGSNTLSSGTGVLSTSTLGGTNGLPGINHSGGNSLQPSNPLTNNALSTNPPSIFGSPIQKENMWSANTNNNAAPSNLFVSNTSTNSLQKPTTFTFGSSTQFNATSSTPAFGSSAQPSQNIFGMAAQNNSSQPNLFSNPVANQNPAPMFGSPPPNNNSGPQLSMFGTPNISATPAFGAPNTQLPQFEATSMTPAPAPAFSFGAQAQSAPVFGFGQQQPQQQQEQAGGVYSFGAPQQVQFNMGTVTNPPRRIRKAARRTQR